MHRVHPDTLRQTAVIFKSLPIRLAAEMMAKWSVSGRESRNFVREKEPDYANIITRVFSAARMPIFCYVAGLSEIRSLSLSLSLSWLYLR